MAQIKVLIADDHALVRMGVRLLIASQKDLTLVAEVKNGKEAVAAVERLRPDVAVLDLLMPQMDGIEATARIRDTSPATQVVILTSYGTSDGLSQALTNGLSNPDIAQELGIDMATVKTHIAKIFEKLGVANRSEAVAIALRKQLVKI